MDLHEIRAERMPDSYRNTTLLFLIMGIGLMHSGCTRLVESEPPSGSLTGITVYKTDATAIAAFNGIYIGLNGRLVQGLNSIGLLAGLSADELSLYNGVTDANYLGYYYNSLSQKLGTLQSGVDSWSPLYTLIFNCNVALEGLTSTTSLTPAVKQQLLGEATFLRAFSYFYLVNFYGDLPLVLTTDAEVNTLLARSTKAEVYQQIIADLNNAEANLSENFLNETLVNTTTERVRPTKWVASALLARVYLYMGEWEKAAEKATVIVDKKSLFDLVPLNNVFLKNSKEAIWQLQPTEINYNTIEAQVQIIPQTGPNAGSNPIFLSDTLINSFEAGDLRTQYGNWVDTTIYKLTSTLNDTVAYSNKYKLNMLDGAITSTTGTANMNEYFMMLRLSEQYLIRAEARAQLGNISGAKDDLNAVRNRAFLPAKSITTDIKTVLLLAILHERQVELFMEWGHRWLDLKRTGKIDEVMNGITPLKAKGAAWQSYQQWYPLPRFSDLEKAPNLIQNEGY
jgi:starch-binding outer membrane protein, SusD/RagB family